MKIKPENIIINIENQNLIEKIFLITGNEETLITSIEDKLIEYFKAKGFVDIERKDNVDVGIELELKNEKSLFFTPEIKIYRNPKSVNLDYCEQNNLDSRVIIISDSSIKNSSKIKKGFDSSKKLYSISCYQVSRALKKQVFDSFCNKNQFKIQRDGYLFFLDNSPNIFSLFNNEMNKLLDYGEKNIELNDIKLLMTNDMRSDDFDFLFFLTMGDKSKIIKKSKDILESTSDAYYLIQRMKFYLEILHTNKSINDIDKNFPKYLFKYKDSFMLMYKKMNDKKILKILDLIKKTEILLRKNSDFYFIVLERCLLNMSNVLK